MGGGRAGPPGGRGRLTGWPERRMAEEDTNDVTELKTKLRRQLKAINRKL